MAIIHGEFMDKEIQQPHNDQRLQMNGVWIGCVTKQNADMIMAYHDITNCVYQYIDRMNDVCPEDTADNIIAEFATAVTPLIHAHLDAKFPKKEI